MQTAGRMLLLMSLVAACGGEGTGTQVDAGTSDGAAPDAGLPDAAARPERFVVSRQRVPATQPQVQEFGLDLDGDDTVDNKFGQGLATLASQGFDVQSGLDVAVANGEIITLIEVVASSLVEAATASAVLLPGTNPVPLPCDDAKDVECGNHLDGEGLFDVAAVASAPVPLVGTIEAGTLLAGPGEVVLQVGLGESAVTLIGARVMLTDFADGGIGEGIVAGAISEAEMDAVVYPALADWMNQQVEVDCTQAGKACGCTIDSTGESILAFFDADSSCDVDGPELASNGLLSTFFATDVTIDGVDAVSFGCGVSAVGALFTN